VKEPIKYSLDKHGLLKPKAEVLEQEASAPKADSKADKKPEKKPESKPEENPNTEKKTLKLPEKE